MEGLVHHSLLREWTAAEEWLLPGEEDVSSPPDGYVVSFAHFHERGLVTSAHRFLSEAAALLQDRSVASQSQRNPAHGDIHCPMRGVPRDQPPLRIV